MARIIQGKTLFSLAEIYRIYVLALRTVPAMVRGERTGLLSKALRERLMIAVTEVNGCAMCSWYHARVALETGLDSDEVRRMLAGEFQGVPEEEATAILFARHTADMRGNPSPAAWTRLQNTYGKAAALSMLGAIRGIMLGNALGIPSGSLLHRLGVKRFTPDSRSTIFYELTVLTAFAVMTPFALIHAAAARLLRLPVEPHRGQPQPE
jgi:AhpD family alkylhydroperoxidase